MPEAVASRQFEQCAASSSERSLSRRAIRTRLDDHHLKPRLRSLGEILGDAMVAAALIDRLVHHATMVNLKGKSYRLRERGTDTAPKVKPSRQATQQNSHERRASLAGYAGSHPQEKYNGQRPAHFSPPEPGALFSSC